MTVDSALEAARAIISSVSDRLGTIRSEEDAKLQIITRMVTEVLGWAHGDISSEKPNENGFSDYLVSDGDHKAFVIEAKRIGEISLATASYVQGTYKISGPVLKPAAIGISQAASYCHPEGVPLAVLTDGLKWIIFLPWVPQTSYRDKQAIVFPTLDSIINNFSLFYEVLSKAESRRGTFRIVFDQVNENRLVLERPLKAAIAASENAIVQKSPLAFDLDKVFSGFFSGLTGDEDPDMIIECFVETKESRVADFSLERITRNVLGNLSPRETDVGEGLQAIVRDAVAGEPGQTVFIVGPSGAGKSTFLDRFFKRTLSPEVREQCLVIHVNALDASGGNVSIVSWLTERCIENIEKVLFPEGYPEWNHLQALYHLEYLKRAKGVDARLYERDKEAFKDKFALYVEEQVAIDREGYLRRLLADVVRNRKRLPVFVVDNTDEFEIDFKTIIFQYFQALRRSVDHCLLLFPATDRSAWTFSKTEIFNIYSSRSFFLPTPSPREVFRKRIEYLKKKLRTADEEKSTREYFVGRGIRLQIPDLGAFADVVEEVFVKQDYPSRVVGELSNYNMRKALGLSKRIITSSVLKIEDLIRSYLTGTMVAPTQDRFMNALVKGDYELFKHGDEPLIVPIYQVDGQVRQSPLTQLRLLSFLERLREAASEETEQYVTVNSLKSYFDVIGISEVALQKAIEALLQSGLVEPYDLSKKSYSEDQRIAISQSGVRHVGLATSNAIYFEQMALTTRIADSEVVESLRRAYHSKKSHDARFEEVRTIFCKYLVEEDERFCLVPESDQYQRQRDLVLELSARWAGAAGSGMPGSGSEFKLEGARGVVERVDQARGFGFVDIPTIKDTAFLHASVLEKGGFEDVQEGDEIVCDLTRNDKGFTVVQVRELSRVDRPILRGQVAKLFDERGYGFIYVPQTGADAFFHYHILSHRQKSDLYEGQELLVEVVTDVQGRSQVKRVIDQPSEFERAGIAAEQTASG